MYCHVQCCHNTKDRRSSRHTERCCLYACVFRTNQNTLWITSTLLFSRLFVCATIEHNINIGIMSFCNSSTIALVRHVTTSAGKWESTPILTPQPSPPPPLFECHYRNQCLLSFCTANNKPHNEDGKFSVESRTGNSTALCRDYSPWRRAFCWQRLPALPGFEVMVTTLPPRRRFTSAASGTPTTAFSEPPLSVCRAVTHPRCGS